MPREYLLRPAHPGEDFKSYFESQEIKKLKCLHCGEKFEYGVLIYYTRLLSTNKLIWWHASHIINDYD